VADTASTSEIPPRPSSRLSSWLGILIVVATLLIVLAILLGTGYLLWQTFVVPYQHIESTAPVPLGPPVNGCQPQVEIEHPARLSLDDQGVQPTKRIVLALYCEAPLTRTASITFEIKPDQPDWVRFLDAQGADASPILAVAIPPGGQGCISLYPECMAQPVDPPFHLSFAVTATSAAAPAASFIIGLESRPQTFVRRVIISALEPLSAGQLTLLGSLVALLWRWWDAWSKRQREFNNLYGDMWKKRDDLAALRELYSRYQGLQGAFPRSAIFHSPRIEALCQTAEAEECLHRAIEDLESGDFRTVRKRLDHLSSWDCNHWAISVLGCLVNLLTDDLAPNPQKCLEQLRRGWDKAGDWPHLRRQMVRALSRISHAEARKFLESLDDPAPSVRIEIAWAFSRRERPPDLDQRLQRSITASLDEWFYSLGEPLQARNPFGEAFAESDPTAEPFIWEHPLYRQLYLPAHTVMLAPAGGGKTTARLALKRRFWGTQDAFMLEYTDFHRLIGHLDRITARRHVAEILRCAAHAVSNLLLADPERLAAVKDHRARRLIHDLLANHLSDPYLVQQLSATLQEVVPLPDEGRRSLLSGRLPAEAMRDLVTVVRALGFAELYLLVDRLNNLPETRDPAVAEALLGHLLNDCAFLDVPHLRIKLFLPAEWEPLVVSSSGPRSGRIHLRRLRWNEAWLLAMLKERLQVTGVESLNRLAVDNIYPSDLDRALAREADGLPCHLIELGEALLCLRALDWEESGRDPSRARLRTEDWAAMLEYGLRRTAERRIAAR
jgi:hypothetical protein